MYTGNSSTISAFVFLIILFMNSALFSQIDPTSDLCTWQPTAPGPDPAATHYASPGDNLESIIGQLSPGDVLNLAGGTYYGKLTLSNVNGTASNPIVIQSEPGERAMIVDAIQDFTDAPNNDWELVDGSISLYRSVNTYSGEAQGGWLLDYELLMPNYSADGPAMSWERFVSTAYDQTEDPNIIYVGPGVFHHSDGHIYVRLEQNPTDLDAPDGGTMPLTITDTDPRNTRIIVYLGSTFEISSSEHVVFRNIDFGPGNYTFELESGARHIEITGCNIRFQSQGILVRKGTSDLHVHDNFVTMGFPNWNYWTDVKNDPGHDPLDDAGWNSFAVAGSWTDSYIHDNVLKDCFDGISVSNASRNTRVMHNYILHSHDDAIDIKANNDNCEIAYNVIRHCFEGVSLNGDDGSGTIGEVYVHHNIIDVGSGTTRGRRIFESPEHDILRHAVGIAFGGHDCGGGDCDLSESRFYNNTIISAPPQADQATPQRPKQMFYNNIVYIIGDGAEVEEPTDNRGNVYWATEGNLPGFVNSEPEALVVDPGFNDNDLAGPYCQNSVDTWELYRPTNVTMFTRGQSYDSVSWPGTEGVNYRGAISGEVNYVSLTVNVSGSGSVLLDPPGGIYKEGTVVTLTANPDTCWQFDNWSGDLSGSSNPETITMNSYKTVTATFIISAVRMFFQQDSGSDGIVSMEAENYDGNVSQGGFDWTSSTSTSGHSGSAYMVATPDSGETVNSGYESDAPRLDFRVRFVKTGTHYVWIRGNASDSDDNSVHTGLDGSGSSFSDRIEYNNSGNWEWTKDTIDDSSATIEVSSTGIHTLNIWMREDGVVLDKVVLATTASYTPNGTGPPESPRESKQYSLTVDVSGSGSVLLDPPGGIYNECTAVILTAEPVSGGQFDGWSGDLSGSTNPTTIYMYADMSVTANFSEIPAVYDGYYAIIVTGDHENSNAGYTGDGYADTDQFEGAYVEWINVTAAATDSHNCTIRFANGSSDRSADIVINDNVATSVIFESTGSFENWLTRTVRVVLNAGTNSFRIVGTNPDALPNIDKLEVENGAPPAPLNTLTVNTIGSGSVSLNPFYGIYNVGTTVTLTANPVSGWQFEGWSGDLSGSANPETITMDVDKTVTAIFTGSGMAFQQDSGPNGIVSLEAENYDGNVSQGSHNWTLRTSPSGYSGNGLVQAMPNTDTNNNSGYESNSPRLDFQVRFVKTGTHYVWVRGYASDSDDNSVHAGLDGIGIETSDRIEYSASGNWNWSNDTRDNAPATIEVGSTGVHTLNIWMREDGVVLDKIVLTTSSNYTPSGTGPVESPRESIIGIRENNIAAIPTEFTLSTFPNPFNPSTNIIYTLPKTERVTLIIYDILGRKIATLANGKHNAGKYTVQWQAVMDNGNQVASGVFLARIQTDSFTQTIKLVLLK